MSLDYFLSIAWYQKLVNACTKPVKSTFGGKCTDLHGTHNCPEPCTHGTPSSVLLVLLTPSQKLTKLVVQLFVKRREIGMDTFVQSRTRHFVFLYSGTDGQFTFNHVLCNRYELGLVLFVQDTSRRFLRHRLFLFSFYGSCGFLRVFGFCHCPRCCLRLVGFLR